jgi:hypothetical protein
MGAMSAPDVQLLPACLPERRELPRRRGLLQAGLTLAVLGLSVGAGGVLLQACSTVPHEYEISEAQIMQALTQRLPYERRVLEVVDLRLARPRLSFLPERNRLGLELDVSVQDQLFTRRELQGVVALTTGLRFETGDRTIRLQDVQLERFKIEGLSEALSSRLNRVAGLLTEQQLEGMVLRQFTQAEVDRASRLGVRPGAFKVGAHSVILQLEPI